LILFHLIFGGFFSPGSSFISVLLLFFFNLFLFPCDFDIYFLLSQVVNLSLLTPPSSRLLLSPSHMIPYDMRQKNLMHPSRIQPWTHGYIPPFTAETYLPLPTSMQTCLGRIQPIAPSQPPASRAPAGSPPLLCRCSTPRPVSIPRHSSWSGPSSSSLDPSSRGRGTPFSGRVKHVKHGEGEATVLFPLFYSLTPLL
jgi:hypothetical protein